MNSDLQELELQEKNFNLWYAFMRDTQLSRINQYLSNNIANTEEEVGQCEQFVQQLNEVQDQFEQLKQEQYDNVNNIEYTIEEKKDKMGDLVNALNLAKDTVSQIIENFDEKVQQRQVLFQQFESENQLIQLKELPTQDFKDLFKLYNYVFFDSTELQWPKFQQVAFGKELNNPNIQQASQQKEQVSQSVSQQVQAVNQPQQLLQIPEKDEEQEKEVLNSEQNEQEIPLSKNFSNQEQKQQIKQQVKKSQFKQKMIHLKVEELSDVKRDKLAKYFVQENKEKVINCDSYKQNHMGFKNLFAWLENFYQIDELQKERLNAQSELKKIQKEFDDTKKQYNIDFDEATLKFYRGGIEESESLQIYVEQSLGILQKLTNTFEDSKQFFEGEGSNMQNILNALQGQMQIPKEIYKKVEKTK